MFNRRELAYAKSNFNEVLHTTLNPGGPGVVRIHLIPPKVTGRKLAPSMAIINGQDIVPVNRSWSILLAEFIKEVNKYAGREIGDEEMASIMEQTSLRVQKVYPRVRKERLCEDVYTMMNAFKQIAYGEPVDEEIGYMNLGEYAGYMKAPHRMDLMVSSMTKDGAWHCNQKCIHCYAAGQPQAEERELGAEAWKAILDKCKLAGISQVTFTGGEPTMRDDLIELIKYARWFISRLNTNGVKLTEEYCRSLREAELDSMQITFYSADEAIHNQLVGAPGYAKTVAGIKNALAAGLNVSINTPLCKINGDYVQTLQFLRELGIQYVTCSGLITTGNGAGELSVSTQLSESEIKQILQEAVAYCYSNGMEISFTSPGWVDSAFCEELSISTPACGACLSNMAVTPGGNVVPCQSWLTDKCLGNMLDDEWQNIWNSDTCVVQRQYASKMLGECPLRKK